MYEKISANEQFLSFKEATQIASDIQEIYFHFEINIGCLMVLAFCFSCEFYDNLFEEGYKVYKSQHEADKPKVPVDEQESSLMNWKI